MGTEDHSRDAAGHFASIHVRQAEIENDQVRTVGNHSRKRFRPGGGGKDGIAFRAERRIQESLDGGFVVNDQHPQPVLGHRSPASLSGREIVIVVPPPGRFSAAMNP